MDITNWKKINEYLPSLLTQNQYGIWIEQVPEKEIFLNRSMNLLDRLDERLRDEDSEEEVQGHS